MSSSINPASHPSAEPQDTDDIDLLGILRTLLGAKWLIAIVTVLMVGMAAAYALFSAPVYQTNTLIQVEQGQNTSNGALNEMAVLLDVQSSAIAEMEILRSRLVVSQAVDELQLYIHAEPNYFPVVGRWLAKRSADTSTPGLFGYGGYTWGAEAITVTTLDVPALLQDEQLRLIATDTGYQLQTPEGAFIVEGNVGVPASFTYGNDNGLILVSSLSARPGARFNLVRTSRLTEINKLQNNLNITEKGKTSGMLAVSLEGTNPTKTTAVLNAVGDAYVRQNIQRKAAEAEKTLAFLDAFLPELRKQMESSEESYTQFRDTHGTFDLGAEGRATLDSTVQLQVRLLELQQRRRELIPQFTAVHPVIKVIDEQVDAVNQELAKQMHSIQKMPDLEQQMLSLMRNVQVNSEMYVNLLNSAQQLRLVKEGKVGNVRVVDHAVIPEEAVKPQRRLVLAAGLLLGVILGCAIALIRSKMNQGITTPNEIESALGLHVFASVPHAPEQSRLQSRVLSRDPGNHTLATMRPGSPTIESLRSLRTALQFAMLEANNNIVLLTGPTPDTGKSFISVNFAAVLGATKKRILLIDADLRKGYIHQYFGFSRRKGLSELITGSQTADEVIHKSVLPYVDLITTGTLPPNPSELLLTASAIQALKDLSSRYDLIILDTAPILPVSDTMALAPHAGTVFLLARAGVSTVHQLGETVKRLRQAGSNVKGVIFNDMTYSKSLYGSSYGNYQYGPQYKPAETTT